MIVSSLDMALVIIASMGAALVLGGIAQGLGWQVPPFMLVGGGLPLLIAWYWHSRVVADKEAAYVRQTDASTQVKLAALAAPQSAPPTPTVPDDVTEQAWRTALERFFRAGDKAGSFSIRALQGVVGSTTWASLTDFYCSLEGGQVLRRVPGDEGTQWGHSWTLDDVTRKLALGTLPHPDGPVPSVELYVGNTTQQHTKRQRATAKKPAIIDAEPSRPA